MTLGQMKALVSQRLNEAGNPVFYPASEIQNALNESQRLWCLLTLCLEKTATWNTAPTWTHLLPLIPDYLAPLRLTTQTGMKVRPARISELFALDSQWPASVGPTYRYVALGADLVGIYPTWPQPLQLQYAGSRIRPRFPRSSTNNWSSLVATVCEWWKEGRSSRRCCRCSTNSSASRTNTRSTFARETKANFTTVCLSN